MGSRQLRAPVGAEEGIGHGSGGPPRRSRILLLGELLAVPQPRGAVYLDGTEWSWMSERIEAAGEHWDPDMRDLVVNLDELGRVLALDALVFNEDRHRRNLLVQPVDDEGHLRVWAIDAGNAEIGYPDDFLQRTRTAPSPRNHARGLPIGRLAASALAAADVATNIPEQRLVALVAETCELGRENRTEKLNYAVLVRCRRAPEIVASYLDALGALR